MTDLTEEYLALIEQVPSHARHHVEKLPSGQTFRSFPSCEDDGPFLAIVTDTPAITLEVGCMAWPSEEILRHYKTGRGYGHSALEALQKALAEYRQDGA